MTDEELDLARAEEARRLWTAQEGIQPHDTVIAARLAREGWTPTDPLLIEAREICAAYARVHGEATAPHYAGGHYDNQNDVQCTLTALRRSLP